MLLVRLEFATSLNGCIFSSSLANSLMGARLTRLTRLFGVTGDNKAVNSDENNNHLVTRKERLDEILRGYRVPGSQWQHVHSEFVRDTTRDLSTADNCVAVTAVTEEESVHGLRVQIMFNALHKIGPPKTRHTTTKTMDSEKASQRLDETAWQQIWKEFTTNSHFVSIVCTSPKGLEEFCFRRTAKTPAADYSLSSSTDFSSIDYWFWHVHHPEVVQHNNDEATATTTFTAPATAENVATDNVAKDKTAGGTTRRRKRPSTGVKKNTTDGRPTTYTRRLKRQKTTTTTTEPMAPAKSEPIVLSLSIPSSSSSSDVPVTTNPVLAH